MLKEVTVEEGKEMVTRVGSVATLFYAVSPSGQHDTERKGTVEKCLAGGLNSPPDGLSVPLIVPEKCLVHLHGLRKFLL